MTAKIAYINARVIDPASGVDHAASESGGVLTDGASIVAMGPDIFNGGRPAVEDIVWTLIIPPSLV